MEHWQLKLEVAKVPCTVRQPLPTGLADGILAADALQMEMNKDRQCK
jgi:hypothetical protein